MTNTTATKCHVCGRDADNPTVLPTRRTTGNPNGRPIVLCGRCAELATGKAIAESCRRGAA